MVDELAKARIPFVYLMNWLNLEIVEKEKHEGGHGPVVTLEIPKDQIHPSPDIGSRLCELVLAARKINSVQMRRVEQTVAGVGGATTAKAGVGKAKCDKVNICVTGECLVESAPGNFAPGNALGLNDTSNHHDANSGMEAANMLHELDNRCAGIDYRIYQYDSELSLQMIERNVLSLASMDEHGKREGFADAKGHGFSTAHERRDRRLLLVEKPVAHCLTALDMPDWTFFETRHIS